MDYGIPERRRSKKDLRKKRKGFLYRRGGKYRSANVGDKKEAD